MTTAMATKTDEKQPISPADRRTAAALRRPMQTTGDIAGVLVAVARDVIAEDLGTGPANTVNSSMKGVLKAQEMAQRYGAIQNDGQKQLTVSVTGEGLAAHGPDGPSNAGARAREAARQKAIELRRQLADAERTAEELGADLT